MCTNRHLFCDANPARIFAQLLEPTALGLKEAAEVHLLSGPDIIDTCCTGESWWNRGAVLVIVCIILVGLGAALIIWS